MNNIYLAGSMGCGKSTIGKILSKKLNIPFIDLDEEIEREAGKKIPLIFKEDGEEEFRKLETKCLERIVLMEGFIVSLGGGTLLTERNYNILSNRKVYALVCDFKVAYNRCRKDFDRPLMGDFKIFKERSLIRQEKAKKICRAKVRTDKMDPVSELLLLLQEEIND